MQQDEITEDEANVLLLSEYQTTVTRKKMVIYPKVPNVEYIRLAHLYSKMYIWMNFCLDVCGLHSETVSFCILHCYNNNFILSDRFQEVIRFDGPNFHNLMDELMKANNIRKEELLSVTKPIWTFDQ